jgi:tRNA 2-thiouridine synthesizing protein A
MTARKADIEIDVSGYNCPIPLLRTKKALSGMAPGQVLRVVSTDPGSEIDFRVYTERTGHALLAFEERNGAYVFFIEKSQ